MIQKVVICLFLTFSRILCTEKTEAEEEIEISTQARNDLMTRYPDNLFDPMCTDQAGCIYLQRYKAIFHFMDDNAEKIVNSDDQAKEKADKFK